MDSPANSWNLGFQCVFNLKGRLTWLFDWVKFGWRSCHIIGNDNITLNVYVHAKCWVQRKIVWWASYLRWRPRGLHDAEAGWEPSLGRQLRAPSSGPSSALPSLFCVQSRNLILCSGKPATSAKENPVKLKDYALQHSVKCKLSARTL